MFYLFVAFCSDPPEVANAVRTSNGSTKIYSIVKYSCKEGFTEVGGNNRLRCVLNERGMNVWEGDVLMCVQETVSTGIVSLYLISIKLLQL